MMELSFGDAHLEQDEGSQCPKKTERELFLKQSEDFFQESLMICGDWCWGVVLVDKIALVI